MHAPLRDIGSALSSTRLSARALDAVSGDTPFIAYDLEVVSGQLRYAVMCNPDPAILRRIIDGGAGFEVASLGELLDVTSLGVPADQILYSNPVKPPMHVAASHLAGVQLFAVDSVEEVEKVAENAPGAAVYVRVRVDDTSSRFPLSSKFGVSHDQAVAILLGARDLGLEPAGLTFHVGSQCTDVDAWAHALEMCGRTMTRLSRRGLRLRLLNLGGGFPADYGSEPVPALDDIGGRVLAALDRLPYVPDEVVCEPGRALVAEAGAIATTIIGRTERDGRHWVYTDVGAYNGLMECAQTGGRMEFPLSTSRHDDPRTIRCTVTGPSCDSSDTLFKDAQLPAATAVGDRLYIGSAGAYSLCYAAPFNGFPVPRPVYLND